MTIWSLLSRLQQRFLIVSTVISHLVSHYFVIKMNSALTSISISHCVNELRIPLQVLRIFLFCRRTAEFVALLNSYVI